MAGSPRAGGRPGGEHITVRAPRRPLAALAVVLAMLGTDARGQQAVRTRSLGGLEWEVPGGFTKITAVRGLADGAILISDRGEQRLYAARPGSSEVLEVGRIGEGPREYRGAGRLLPLGRDSTLFLDRHSGRWLVLVGSDIRGTTEADDPARDFGPLLWGVDKDGTRYGALTSRPSATLMHADSAYLVAASTSGRRDTITVLAGASQDIVSGKRGGRNYMIGGNPLASSDGAVIFPDGWVAVARARPYRVDWLRPDGTWLEGGLLRSSAPAADERVRCAALQRWMGAVDRCDTSIVEGWPEELPPFLTEISDPVIFPTPDGHLLIERTPETTDDAVVYDEVDRTGRLYARFSLPLGQRIVGFGHGGVYVATLDELDVATLRTLLLVTPERSSG